MAMRLLTKEEMVERLSQVQEQGWIKSLRPLNAGGIGNTIDSLLGFPENNLPIQDTAQWELKSHRVGSSALLTLFSIEPEPRETKVVPTMLLPNYGWPHRKRPNELSFRQTLRASQPTNRGFGVRVDREAQQVVVYFNSVSVADHHSDWLGSVRERVGLGPLSPMVYWPFRDLLLKASTKMLNSFYVEAEARKQDEEEYFRIARALMLEGFESERFITAIEHDDVLPEFDARTRKNHGSKFRLRQAAVPKLYRYSQQVL